MTPECKEIALYIYILHDFIFDFLSEDVQHVPRCTVYGAGLIVGEWLYSYTSCRYDMVMVPDKRNAHRTHSRGS